MWSLNSFVKQIKQKTHVLINVKWALLTHTLYSSWVRSLGSRSGLPCRCSLPAYIDPPAASSSSELPSALHKTHALRYNNAGMHKHSTEEVIQCEATESHRLTSLLGLGHHLFILLPVFLGLLCRLGGQITAKQTGFRAGIGNTNCSKSHNGPRKSKQICQELQKM